MAIEVKNISYTYPGSTVTAVENVSMKIEKGERVAIIGQNGAGKSTTVKLMNNIYKPTSGEMIIWILKYISYMWCCLCCSLVFCINTINDNFTRCRFIYIIH